MTSIPDPLDQQTPDPLAVVDRQIEATRAAVLDLLATVFATAVADVLTNDWASVLPERPDAVPDLLYGELMARGYNAGVKIARCYADAAGLSGKARRRLGVTIRMRLREGQAGRPQ